MREYIKLSEIQADIAAGKITCAGLVEHYLSKINERPDLSIFVEVFEDEARVRAKEIDEKIQKGNAGRLAGLVIGIKDVLCYRGHILTAASKILEGFESQITATAVQKLLDEDAIIIGRQNCDEFAMGSSSENSCYAPVKNPIDPTCVPGGSSGGSAAAVAAGFCHASLGSDTGGSVRQPASFCGVVGIKPTYGRVSRWGLIAYASSFDQIGPLTKSVEDGGLLLQLMAGYDPKDITSSKEMVPDYTNGAKKGKKYTIGIINETIDNDGLDPEIRARLEKLINELKAKGHDIKECSFPYMDYVVPCYYILTTAEASSNLSRYDGIRYGYRDEAAMNLQDVYIKSRTQGFGDEVKRRIVLGTFVLSAGYYDAYYTKAMKVRRLIQKKTLDLLQDCDFILTPTAPSTAFKLGEKTADPVEMYLSDIYTVHANLAGVPSVSLPLGQHTNGLPFGFQLLGRHFDEANMLHLAQEMLGF